MSLNERLNLIAHALVKAMLPKLDGDARARLVVATEQVLRQIVDVCEEGRAPAGADWAAGGDVVLRLAGNMVANERERPAATRLAVREAAKGCCAARVPFAEAFETVVAAAQSAGLSAEDASAAFRQAWARAEWVAWRRSYVSGRPPAPGS